MATQHMITPIKNSHPLPHAIVIEKHKDDIKIDIINNLLFI
jgi:hypothetical protein